MLLINNTQTFFSCFADEKNNNRTSNNNTEETTSVIFTCDSVGDNTNNCDKEPVVHLGNMSQMLILGDTSVFEVY